MYRGAFPPISTRQSFVDEVEVFSDDSSDPDPRFDLTGCTIKVSIAREGGAPLPTWSGPVSYYDTSFCDAPVLNATTADGTVTIPDIGVFQFSFTADQIASLCPGQYVVGANLSRYGETAQLILGNLSVLDGVVPQ